MDLQHNRFTKLINESIFYITCALVLVSASCHWFFDIAYKYIVGASSNIIDYKFCALLAAIIIVFYIVKNKAIPIDFEMVILLVTLAYVGYLDHQAGNFADVCYWYILFSAYLLGRVALGRNSDMIQKEISILFLALVAGMFVELQ